MSKKRYIPRRQEKPIVVFKREAKLIFEHYPKAHCDTSFRRLTCKIPIQPDSDSTTYMVRIQYDYMSPPKVKILNPIIKPSTKYHVYANGNLCLYYPKEQPWDYQNHLYDTIVPWVAEWLVFYELYQVCGKWLGPEQPHGNQKEEDNTKHR